jgi:N-alpha-acetyltransferase 50
MLVLLSLCLTGDVTPANVEQLRMINVSTLPVRYSDKFYLDLLEKGNKDYLKFACWNGFNVGAVCARIEPFLVDTPGGGSAAPQAVAVPTEVAEDDSRRKLYIMTINVLPAYRRQGVASLLLDSILKTATLDPTIAEVYLHVQISNDEALQFYTSRGFSNEGIIENYYKRIEPPHGYILRKRIDRSPADIPVVEAKTSD